MRRAQSPRDASPKEIVASRRGSVPQGAAPFNPNRKGPPSPPRKRVIAKDKEPAATAAAQSHTEGEQTQGEPKGAAVARRAPHLTPAQRKAQIRTLKAQEQTFAAQRQLLLSAVLTLTLMYPNPTLTLTLILILTLTLTPTPTPTLTLTLTLTRWWCRCRRAPEG